MNLPNSLTLTRIFLVPLLVVVLLTKFEGRMILGVRKELVGAAIFGLASLTDWLDGYLARRRKQVTALGQVIDPLADKLLTSAAFISLVQMGLAPAWMVAVIIGREFAVTALRSLAYARGVAIAGVAARQDQDGRAGRRDSGADPRRRALRGFRRDRAGRRSGWSWSPRWCRRPTTSGASTALSPRGRRHRGRARAAQRTARSASGAATASGRFGAPTVAFSSRSASARPRRCSLCLEFLHQPSRSRAAPRAGRLIFT